MDPDETFRLLLAALKVGDREAVVDAGEALLHWLQRGGFPPQVTIGVKDTGLLFELEDHWLNYRFCQVLIEFLLASNRD